MRRHRLAILVGFLASQCIATAQEPPPVSFKTEVNYVEVGAVVTDEPSGNGRVISWATDPMYRGYTEGTKRLLWNAIVQPDP